MTTEILLLSIATFLVYLFFFYDGRHKNFPKGPVGVPILGYLPWLVPKVHVNISKLGKTYGNVFSVKIAAEFFVVLNDFETVKKAMKMEAFSGRPRHMIALEMFKYGIAYNHGPEWTEQRRFALKTLRDFGFGKKSMEAIMHENVDELMDYFRQSAGTPQSLHEPVSMTALNLIWEIVTGSKVALNDSLTKKVIKLTREGVFEKATNGPIYVLPWFAKMFPKLSGLDSIMTCKRELYKIMTDQFEQHKREFKAGQEPRDFVDVYLQKMHDAKEAGDTGSSFWGEKGLENFRDVMCNLFSASTDTITNTIQFAILFLLKWPETMRKLREEIDEILGERKATWEDKMRMPYTEAVMQECFRLASIAPSAVLHSTMEDVEFEGFFIPKGTTIYPNLFQIHRDPEYWERSGEFWPERFLTKGSDGALCCRKDERVIPFGVGKRDCIAASMAEKEFFIFLTRFIQNFEIEGVGVLPGVEVKTSFVLTPEKYQVVFTPRK